MHRKYYVVFGFIVAAGLISCKKELHQQSKKCSTDATISRTLSDKKATVEESGGIYFLVEENTIDTKLRACNLPEEFMIDMLAVTFSGLTRVSNENMVCCVEDLEILKITK
ncbi:hypothetical protein [Pollutibacter soli]|uniref:hypothetical protein n=1 Tax=Pollutibacter soli TaxID=3034157 RepID=UPI0030132408